MNRKSIPVLFLLFFISGIFVGCNEDEPGPPIPAEPLPETAWVNLLDKDLSQWDKFIGVPHYSVNLPNYPKGDGMNGTPVGLNNDPLLVFKMEEENGQPVLHVSGEIYGGLSTKQEYSNYHFKTEFKWGMAKYEPRLNDKRDSGLLYHAKGNHGAFWNVWMLSQEMQVQETDIGDYFALGPGMDIRAAIKNADNENTWIYDPSAGFHQFGLGSDGRCRRSKNMEKPNGEWNTLELICLGQKSIHVVNGEVVMVLENSREKLPDGNIVPLTNGKIQLQSEAAEAFYRNIQIRQIAEIPEAYR